jgi:ribosome-binding protein aMBF1 (putative translation factor)
MSENDTCKFGHTFKVDGDPEFENDDGDDVNLTKALEEGEINSLEDLQDLTGTYFLAPIMGDHWKKIKVSGSQGDAFTMVMPAADKFDDDLGYDVEKTEEKIFVSPQSSMHDEFMNRRQQAEQRVKSTMQGFSELLKEKQVIEHDIRKLRSRVENFESRDETVLKADFIELVDGAGGGQQGGDRASLKFLRDQNIYPSIVADFNEMDGVEDLEEGNKLGHLPENIKAILKKKYTMYEKWKDLYGTEVRRKLNELNSQLKATERKIEETKNWLEPYVKDMQMIQQKETGDRKGEFNKYYTFQGYSSMERNLEFICSQPLTKEDGSLVVNEGDDEETTHYRIAYIHGVQINLANPEQPQSPAGGSAPGVVMVYPAIVCKHVYNRVFQEKIDRSASQFDAVMSDYVGDIQTEEGDKLREARQAKDLSVRELREKIEEEKGEQIPLEVSSDIRRVEDGIDDIKAIEEYLDIIESILEIEDGLIDGEEDSELRYEGLNKKARLFLGQTDEYYLGSELGNAFNDFKFAELVFSWYIDFKKSQGLHTMK